MTSVGVPDIGGPFRGLVLKIDFVRMANPIDGPEQVVKTVVVRDIYPGMPMRLLPGGNWTQRKNRTSAIRITVIEGDGSVLGDIHGLMGYKRLPNKTTKE